MDETEFTSKIAGEVKSAYGQYIYFQPHDLPFDITVDKDIRILSTQALIELSRLDGKASEMEESERSVFLKAFTLKESASSSSIEGTRSTLDDMYRYEKEDPANEDSIRDAKEVMNYKEALDIGISEIKKGKSIDISLLHRMHTVLMSGVRDSNKSPGEFKTSQNAIGKGSDTLDSAKFVPAPPESIEHLIDNLLEYIDSDEDPIIKIATAHYQFESIHPYRDGNGRIGRLLILLMLAKENILNHPVIYPSAYFDRNRDEYLDRLFNVSSKDEFREWFEFFIDALCRQAKDSADKMDDLKAYKKELMSNAKNVAEEHMIGMLFSNPYIKIGDVAENCSVSMPTASKMIAEYERRGILRETTGRKRNTLYCADIILEILGRR